MCKKFKLTNTFQISLSKSIAVGFSTPHTEYTFVKFKSDTSSKTTGTHTLCLTIFLCSFQKASMQEIPVPPAAPNQNKQELCIFPWFQIFMMSQISMNMRVYKIHVVQ